MAASNEPSNDPSRPHKASILRKPRDVRVVRLGKREIVREGIATPIFHDLFHHFMTVSWPRLFATLAAFFLVFDLLFGFLYYLVPGCIANLNPGGFRRRFFLQRRDSRNRGLRGDAPETFYGHLVAMIEIFVGLMSLALITGLMFARFSRPQRAIPVYQQWRRAPHRRQVDIDVSCGE